MELISKEEINKICNGLYNSSILEALMNNKELQKYLVFIMKDELLSLINSEANFVKNMIVIVEDINKDNTVNVKIPNSNITIHNVYNANNFDLKTKDNVLIQFTNNQIYNSVIIIKCGIS